MHKTESEFQRLPALKSLGDLADIRLVIVIDARERTPLTFSRLESVGGTLQSGDYSIVGCKDLFAVERKSIADLASCCVGDNRERFERELHRLRGFRFARLLVVGSVEAIERREYRSRIEPRSVLHSLAAWEARYIPIVFEPDAEAAARRVEQWAYWFAREVVEASNELLRGHRRAAKVAANA